MNTNKSGGYTLQYSNNTANKGIDFTTSTAKPTFERALATWKEIAGANFIDWPTYIFTRKFMMMELTLLCLIIIILATRQNTWRMVF